MINTMINRITIQGFKSFNKKISIPLLKGFNAITGPNGSGKSNLVDAVCFVLGKTSAKSMRADKLHELIFYGTKDKTAAKYASVILYLDNSNKTFPFDEQEISVGRKVNVKGVSVYKINGRNQSRQKVLELLSAVRIHPDGHNIILQGEVTQIIEMNPVERRSLIDEISGIAEYNEKKEKAERELGTVDQKLNDARIVISERYERFRKLEEERNAALRHGELTKRLNLLKASFAYNNLKKIEEVSKDLEERIAKKDELNRQMNERIKEIDSELDEKNKGTRKAVESLIGIIKEGEVEKEVSEMRARFVIKKNEIDTKRREIAALSNVIERLEAMESRKIGMVPHAVKAILDMKLNGVHGTVADLIEVQEKYQTAIEIAAGQHINDIVVETDEVANLCIDCLKKEKIGRARFLPLNKVRPFFFRDNELLGKKGVVGVASKLISYNTKYTSAMEFIFGGTLVVESLDIARTLGIGKARMVTLDGDLTERSGAMTGGYYNPKFIRSSVRDEINDHIDSRMKLRADIEVLSTEANEIEKKLAEYSKSEGAKKYIDIDRVRVGDETEIKQLTDERMELNGKILKMQAEIMDLRIERGKVEARLETAMAEVEKYGQVEYIDERLGTLKRLIDSDSAELQTLGPINWKAVDEYERFRTEFDEYKKKYDKILEERTAVLTMIEQIEGKRRDVFNKCLEDISQHFNGVYAKMTGGSASLSLENPLDLDSGLMIQASPGGKTLQSIDSMSGGEKSLTALAFVFAIQRYKPAPFYILDEIDAALDKENSKIVADLIKELSKEGQFILITHNDTTVQYSDCLYGVTMDMGESKIIGMRMP